MNLNNPDLWTKKTIECALHITGGEKDSCAMVSKSIYNQYALPKYVLEIGCGVGRILKPLHELMHNNNIGLNLIGIDFNPQMIKFAHEYLDGMNIELKVIRDGKFPIKNRSIDFIYSHAVLIHNTLEQIDEIFLECERVLKTGCKMYHDFFNGESEEGIKITQLAQSKNFPAYAHTYDEIQSMAMKYNFVIISTTDLNRGRAVYHFIKVDKHTN